MLDIAVDPFEPLAQFKAVQKKSGEEMAEGVWGGHVPAVAGTFGKGRVAVFGPHPEAGSSGLAANLWVARLVHWAADLGGAPCRDATL